jgi:hypothetical protein
VILDLLLSSATTTTTSPTFATETQAFAGVFFYSSSGIRVAVRLFFFFFTSSSLFYFHGQPKLLSAGPIADELLDVSYYFYLFIYRRHFTTPATRGQHHPPSLRRARNIISMDDSEVLQDFFWSPNARPATYLPPQQTTVPRDWQ